MEWLMRIELWVLILALAVIPSRFAQEPLVLLATINLPGVQGRIDHLAVDADSQRAFVAALGNNTVEVLDLRTNTHVKSLAGFHEPQGIAALANLKAIAVANGEGTGIQLLSSDDYTPGPSVRLGDDADNVRYDAKASRIYVGYGDGALAAIDATDRTVLGRVRFSGHPESFPLEQDGPRAIVNVPSAGQLVVVDRVAMKVIATWPVTTASANFPLAFDESGHRLFVGCRRPAKVIVYDSSRGKEVASFDIVGDTDDIFFDKVRERLYVSGGEGFVDVFDTRPDRRFSRIARVSTAPGARTSLYVPALDRLLVAVPRRDGQKAEVRVYAVR
jgi:DNA-binding beta-propeller fold protein YncE